MMWWLVAGCAVVAGLCGVFASRVLAWLPEPVDADEDKIPYASLASTQFSLILAVCVLGANMVVAAATPDVRQLVWVPLGTIGIFIAIVDAKTTYLPAVLTHVATAMALIASGAISLFTNSAGTVIGSALGAGLVGGLFWLLWRLTGGFGFGDVRLAFLVGATVGSWSVTEALSAALLGSLVGVFWGVVHRVCERRHKRESQAFPYGPSLVAGPYLWAGWIAITAVL